MRHQQVAWGLVVDKEVVILNECSWMGVTWKYRKFLFALFAKAKITISFIFGLLILDRNYATRKIPACETQHSYANLSRI